MSEEDKKKPRVVSKGEYLRHIGAKVGLTSLGGTFFACSIVGFLIFCPGIVWTCYRFWQSGQRADLEYANGLFYIVYVSTTSFLLRFVGKSVLRKARAIESVVPDTRANTSNLPEPESLVRASSEPAQAQETLLLRAAQAAAEELLRPRG